MRCRPFDPSPPLCSRPFSPPRLIVTYPLGVTTDAPPRPALPGLLLSFSGVCTTWHLCVLFPCRLHLRVLHPVREVPAPHLTDDFTLRVPTGKITSGAIPTSLHGPGVFTPPLLPSELAEVSELTGPRCLYLLRDYAHPRVYSEKAPLPCAYMAAEGPRRSPGIRQDSSSRGPAQIRLLRSSYLLPLPAAPGPPTLYKGQSAG